MNEGPKGRICFSDQAQIALGLFRALILPLKVLALCPVMSRRPDFMLRGSSGELGLVSLKLPIYNPPPILGPDSIIHRHDCLGPA
jgi:hypothetical protein